MDHDRMDHDEAPVLDALAGYHRHRRTPFTPPGHKQGRGVDPRVRAVLGEDVFRGDMLATSGLDDRSSSGGVIERAQQLMATPWAPTMPSSPPAAARCRSRARCSRSPGDTVASWWDATSTSR
ncbi:hypothetical protein GCM10009610_03290 [Pseudonocardia xinjiangensis]